MPNTTRLLALLLILLLGWTLRTHDADSRSLWEDEGWTMLLSRGPGLDDVARTMAHDQHPPLYFMLFRLWRSATGESEFAGRYLGILIGMVAVAGMAQLGRVLFNAWAGVLAALILAVADLHIDLSQEIRHYGLLATLVIVSSLFYARWWQRPTRANRAGYVLSSLLLLYTHYLGAYLIAAQTIHLLLMMRPRRRLLEGLFLVGAVGLGFLPWLPVVIDQNSVRWENPLYYQNALPNSLETYHAVRTALLGQRYALLALLMLVGLSLALIQVKSFDANRAGLLTRPYTRFPAISAPRLFNLSLRRGHLWPAVYLLIWLVLVIGVTVWLNERRQFLTVRNFILITPAIALLAGYGLYALPRYTRLFTTALLVVISLTTVDARREYPDWRAVIRNVTDYHLHGEPVLLDVWVGDFPARYYIDRQMGENTPRVSLREWRDEYKTLFLPTLLDYLRQTDAFWLVYWGDKPMDEYGGLIAEAGFQRTAALSVDHQGTPLYSYRYDRLDDTTTATFGDVFALRKFHAPESAASGDTLTVSLWWTAEQIPPLDYSISVFLLDAAGQLAAQHDGPPLAGTSPTSTWSPGDLKYDIHTIQLPGSLPAGDYTLGVKVYWYGDNQPLPVRTGPDAPSADYAILGRVTVR